MADDGVISLGSIDGGRGSSRDPLADLSRSFDRLQDALRAKAARDAAAAERADRLAARQAKDEEKDDDPKYLLGSGYKYAPNDDMQRRFASGVQERLLARDPNFFSQDPEVLKLSSARDLAYRRALVRGVVDTAMRQGGYDKLDPRGRLYMANGLDADKLVDTMARGTYLPVADAGTATTTQRNPLVAATAQPRAGGSGGGSGGVSGGPAGGKPAKTQESDWFQDALAAGFEGLSLVAPSLAVPTAISRASGRGAKNLTAAGDAGDTIRSYVATGVSQLVGGIGDLAEGASDALSGAARFVTAMQDGDAEVARVMDTVKDPAKRDAAIIAARDKALGRGKSEYATGALGESVVGGFLSRVAGEISTTADMLYGDAFKADGTTAAARKAMSDAQRSGDFTGMIGAMADRPDVHVPALFGYILGSGGVGGLLGKRGIIAAGNIAAGGGAADSVEQELRSVPRDQLKDMPGWQRVADKMPGMSDNEIAEAFIESQSLQAGYMSMAASAIGARIAPMSETMLFAAGSIIKQAGAEAAKRGLLRVAGAGAGREFVGEAVQGGGQALIESAYGGGRDITSVSGVDIQRGAASGGFEGLLGAVIGGGASVLGAVASGQYSHSDAVKARDEARAALASRVADMAATDPSVAATLAQGADVEAALVAIQAGVEAADAQAIGSQTAGHNLPRLEESGRDTLDAMLADAPDYARLEGDNVGATPVDNLGGASGKKGRAVTAPDGLTAAQSKALDMTHESDVAGMSITDNPNTSPEVSTNPRVASQQAIHGADAYLRSVKAAFTQGTQTPDPATGGRTMLNNPDPEAQTNAMVVALQQTGMVPGLEVPAASALVEAGIGGIKGSMAADKAIAVARRVAKANPELAGVVDAVRAITREAQTVRALRDRLRNGIKEPEAGKPTPPVIDEQALAGELRGSLARAGMPVIGRVEQRPAATGAAQAVADKLAGKTEPREALPKSKSKAKRRATGKPGDKDYKPGESQADFEKRKNRLRQEAVGPARQVIQHQTGKGFLARLRNVFGAYLRVMNDRSVIVTVQNMAIQAQGVANSGELAVLSRAGANVETEIGVNRDNVDRDRALMEVEYLGPADELATNFDRWAASTYGLTPSEAAGVRELHALMPGVKGRATKKMFEVNFEHLTEQKRLEVNDITLRVAEGLITPQQGHDAAFAIFDDPKNYASKPPGAKLGPDEDGDTSLEDDPDFDTDEGDARETETLDSGVGPQDEDGKRSMFAQVRVDVTTLSDYAANRRVLVTAAGAQEVMDAQEGLLGSEGSSMLDEYVGNQIAAYAEIWELQKERGLVDPRTARFTEMTGINTGYVKHARVNMDSEEGKALDNTFRFDDPVEGGVNWGNRVYRSWMGKENVPPITDLNQTLSNHIASVAVRTAENNVLKSTVRLGSLEGNHNAVFTTEVARKPILDPVTGRFIHPDQPDVKDVDTFLVRDGDTQYLIRSRDIGFSSALRSSIIDQDTPAGDTGMAAIEQAVSKTTRGMARLKLMSTSYIRNSHIRDGLAAASAAWNATGRGDTLPRFTELATAWWSTIENRPAVWSYAFADAAGRQKFYEQHKNSDDEVLRAIAYMHERGGFPTFHGYNTGRGVEAAKRVQAHKQDPLGRTPKPDLASKLVGKAERAAQAVADATPDAVKSALTKGGLLYANGTTRIDQALMYSDVKARLVVFMTCQSFHMGRAEQLGLTEEAVRYQAAANARTYLDFTIRPDLGVQGTGTGLFARAGEVTWRYIRATSMFAHSQNAGVQGNWRTMWKEGVSPRKSVVLDDGTVQMQPLTMAEVADALDYKKLAAMAGASAVSTMAYISAMTAAGAAAVAAGEITEDELEEWIDDSINARTLLRQLPFYGMIVGGGATARDVNGDGLPDTGVGTANVGYDFASWASELGAYAAMYVSGVDMQGATQGLIKAAMDTGNPVMAEVVTGDMAGSAEVDLMKMEVWPIVRNFLPDALTPAMDVGLNRDARGWEIRDLPGEKGGGTAGGRKINTPQDYAMFGSPENVRHLFRNYGGGFATEIDRFLLDAETASKHPETEGAMMRMLGRTTWRGAEMTNQGRYDAALDRVFDGFQTAFADKVYAAKERDQLIGGVKPTDTGPAEAAIARAEPDAYRAYRRIKAYGTAKGRIVEREYLPAKQAGDADKMGELDVKILGLKRQLIRDLRRDHPVVGLEKDDPAYDRRM